MNTKEEKLGEITELLRKCTAAAEQTVATFEASYEISHDLKKTIEKANKLLQELDQDKDIIHEEPSLEELLNTLPMKCIKDIKKCFEACKSKSDIAKVIKAAPAYLGTFWAEYDGSYFTIVNRFLDDDIGEYYEEEYWYDYTEDWAED